MACRNAVTNKALLLIGLVVLGPCMECANSAAVPLRRRSRNSPEPASATGVSNESMKEIALVIETFKDINASIHTQETKEAADYTIFSKWCTDERNDIPSEIDAAQEDLGTGQLDFQQLNAAIDEANARIVRNKKQIQEAQDAIAQHTNIRKEENEKYEQDKQLSIQSQRQLAQAIKITGAVTRTGFLQDGAVKPLEVNEPGEASYALGVLTELQKTLAKKHVDLENTESQSLDNYNSLMTVKRAELKSLQDDTALKATEVTAKRVERVKVEHTNKRLEKQIKQLSESRDYVEVECGRKQKEWEARTKARHADMAAITEAIAYLEQYVKGRDDSMFMATSFVQVRSRATSHAPSRHGGSGHALDGPADTDFEAFVDASGGLPQGKFDGAKKAVMSILRVLQDESESAAEKYKHCKISLAKASSELASTADQLALVNAAISEKQAVVNEREAKEIELEGEIQKHSNSLDDLTKARKSGHKRYLTATKDRTLALKVLTQVRFVLQKFYKAQAAHLKVTDRDVAHASAKAEVAKRLSEQAESFASTSKVALHTLPATEASYTASSLAVEAQDPSFFQINGSNASQLTPTPSPESRPKKPDTWSGPATYSEASKEIIMTRLYDIMESVREEQREGEKEEDLETAAYEKIMRDTQTMIDSFQHEITDIKKLVAKTKVEISTLGEEKTLLQAAKTATEDKVTSLREDCDTFMAEHEEKHKKRLFEIDQLRDVHEILSGSQVAVRTGATTELLEDGQASDASAQDVPPVRRQL